MIHKTQQLNIQSTGLKLVKLSYLVGSVDRNISHKLLVANILNTAAPVLITFTNHNVKLKNVTN